MQPTQNPPMGDRTGPTDDLAEVRSTLLAVAGYLSEHGWIQKEYYADPSCLTPAACTVGALSVVAYGYPAEAPADNFTHPGFDTFEAAMCHLGGYLTHTYGQACGDPYTFNDAPDRTVGEVLAMLREAATSDPGRWVPRCCEDERCVPDPNRPFVVVGEPGTDRFSIERAYECTACLRCYYVAAVDPADVTALRAQWRTWVDSLPHDGAPHTPGMSGDCDTCDSHCFCTTELTCIAHLVEDDGMFSTAVWDVPGQPTYVQLAGGAA
ncbi:hypothetical protein Daura_43520 [Dactylosporangium aurantiacum]|uniref:Uncharacterized protein n=1 Tax=Dactylosporangium aurantiacum TaxID=35754 RepID=A0A9Q9ML14_9ACTN|nr:hypothetical protein [Dactylosporangium aurantiacum]MDG6102349.1 hypothetical protein [Dactylosporangium aurantiacum]UWZ53352.1 hypothetical protein Daura_43520 [Dactylosporangium aurantiacum]